MDKTVFLAFCLACSPVSARDGDRPVLQAPQRLEPAAPRDVVPDFARIYRAAGSPKIVLLWNRALSDRSQLATVDTRVTREAGTAGTHRSERSTSGDAGTMALADEDSRFDRTRTDTRTKEAIAEPTRRIGLEERHAVRVERAFVAEMNRAGVAFVDRALAMRATAATRHRAGGDAQLIETDAIYGYAELLMEVVWIEDKEAPAGYAFDVRTKNLKTGQEVSSVYTRGIGPPAPPRDGAWVAGNDGYEYAPAPRAAEAGPAEVGLTVSHDVMQTLGGVLAAQAPGRPRR